MIINGNRRHFVVAHQNTIAIIPSIVIPDGATDNQRQQLAETAIAHARDHQSQHFCTVEEAVRYLEQLDRE